MVLGMFFWVRILGQKDFFTQWTNHNMCNKKTWDDLRVQD